MVGNRHKVVLLPVSDYTINVYQDGVEVAHIAGPKEWYVHFRDGSVEKFAARFKYAKPKTRAKEWVRFILTHLTTADALVMLKHTTPVELFELLKKKYANG